MQNATQNQISSQAHDPDPIHQPDTELELEDEHAKRLAARKEKAKKRKRRAVAAVTVTLLIIGSAYGLWSWLGSRTKPKINLTVRARPEQTSTESRGSSSPDDIANQAVAEAMGAMRPSDHTTTREPGTSAATGTDPLSTTSPSNSTSAGSNQQETTQLFNQALPQPEPQIVSRRSNERSIRFSQPEAAPTTAVVKVADSTTTDQNRPVQILPASFATQASLPAFGALLPVRALGTIYTLRSGIARLELTRDIRRDGSSLGKGTVLIANVRSGERDRAFLSLTGFIDPETNRLVKLSGEILGADGASGLKGKRHKLSNGWSRAFARIGSSAINVAGAVAAGRISGQPVIITDLGSRTVNPVTSEVDDSLFDNSNGRGFVEVSAGTAGFVLVTQLPEIEARPGNPQPRFADAFQPLTDVELADLLTSGDRSRIQAALPRMSPQMRRLAQAVLNDPEN